MMEIMSVSIGDCLGLYAGHGDSESHTPAELAARTGTHERSAHEWLE